MTEPLKDTSSSEAFARTLAEVLRDNKGRNVVVLDVRDALDVTDFFVLATGDSRPHLKLLHREVKSSVDLGDQRTLVGREGTPEEEWLLTDYGDVMVHLFSSAKREYYDLDSLWADADVISA